MKQRRKIKKSLIILIIGALIASGAIWQTVMVRSDTDQYNSIGDYISLGTYNAHYYSKGQGSTSFVFITGSGTPCAYTDFYLLQEELSRYGQTISFDHGGFGWSSKPESRRDVDSLVSELDLLIEGVVFPNTPVVLLCHSLGSMEAIRYAQTHPERIAGIVFLDGGSPEYYKELSELKSILLNRASCLLRITGLERLLGEIGILLPIYGESIRNPNLPEGVRKLDRAMYYKYTGNTGNLKTINEINENADVVLNGGDIGDIPILVLSSDEGQRWQKVQEQLEALSSYSSQITIEGSSHYLYWSEYNNTKECIIEFIKKIQGRP